MMVPFFPCEALGYNHLAMGFWSRQQNNPCVPFIQLAQHDSGNMLLYNCYGQPNSPLAYPMVASTSLMPQQPLLQPQPFSYSTFATPAPRLPVPLTYVMPPATPDPHSLGRPTTTLELSENDQEEISPALTDYTPSKYRYVYKCVVRHMNVYIRKNREDIVSILIRLGFTMCDIEHAFFTISCQSDTVGKKGCDKTSLRIVNKMIIARSIYTYILRETLYAILQNWQGGKVGKVAGKNIELYKDACQAFYQEAVKMLGQPAQGVHFIL